MSQTTDLQEPTEVDRVTADSVPERANILREWPPCTCGRDVCPDRGAS